MPTAWQRVGQPKIDAVAMRMLGRMTDGKYRWTLLWYWNIRSASAMMLERPMVQPSKCQVRGARWMSICRLCYSIFADMFHFV